MEETTNVGKIALTKEQILSRLAEPFDAEDIHWKPQLVRNGKAMAIAHCDPRAYFKRLSETCGATGWNCHYMVYPVPFAAGVKNSDKHPGKVMVVATLTVHEIGTHSSTGEEWLDNDNAITGAEAQAMKRACVAFGLGEYLYHLPKFWAPYDEEKKRFVEGQEPQLPDWALPKRKCEACNSEIVPFKTEKTEMTITAIIAKSRREYGGQFCTNCMISKRKAKKTEEEGKKVAA